MNSKISVIQAIKGHIQTLAPYFFRRIKLPESKKIEIELTDSDKIRAEHWEGKGLGLAILTHGLEGNSGAVYIRALAKSYLEKGWDVLAWNFRGCGEHLNDKPRLYHSGAIEDLKDVIRFSIDHFFPKKIQLAGFSLGGNLLLVFLSQERHWIRGKKIEKALAISPPLNLAASSKKLEKWWNFGYRWNFLKDLKNKMKRKERQFPGRYPMHSILKSRSIYSFDNVCTAPLHGFKDARDYYFRCSSLYHLEKIEVPTLIVVAKNDPMLARGNYHEVTDKSQSVSFKVLEEGGHCGFWGMNVY